MAVRSIASGGSLYESVLGADFARLHPHVRRAHVAPLSAAGAVDVEHGSHWLVPLLVSLMRLPAAGPRQDVHLDVSGSAGRMDWVRRIGGTLLRTRQRARPPHVVEQLGPGRLGFALTVEDDALVYRQAWMRVAFVALPRSVAPHVCARVSPTAAGWHVDVTVTWRTRLVCHYGGDMEIA
jgi:hypothetical protein